MAVFRVGQRVVCVDASNVSHAFATAAPLKEGEVYTIRRLDAEDWRGPLHLAFEEIKNPIVDNYELTYRASRFRPAVDIEQFRTLVEPAALKQIKRKLVDA